MTKPQTTGGLQKWDDKPHLKDYLGVLISRRWILIGTFFLVVLCTAVWVFVQTPIYRAKAMVLIEPATVNLTEFKGVHDPTLTSMGGELSRREFLETQYKLIVSHPTLEKAFLQFGFGSMDEFRKLKEPLESFTRLFGVSPVRRSRLVMVTFNWKDPELAARVLDYVIEEYITEYRRRTLGVTKGGLEALRDKSAEIRPKVEAKANELQQFMVANDMVSLEKTQNIIVDRLKDLNTKLAEAETIKFECESIYANIRQALKDNRSPEEMPEIAGSAAVRDLKLELIRSRKEYNDIIGRFGPNHPEVANAKAGLAAIEEKMSDEMDIVLASSRARLDRARRQAANLERELQAQEQRVLSYNKVSVQYNMLKENYEAVNKAYKAIVKRIEEIEISMAAGSRDDNIFIIMPPKVPVKPAKPRKKASLALAGVVGMIIGIGLSFFIEYFDTTIKTKNETEKLLGAPVLGYVPALTGREYRRGKDKPDKELAAIDKPRSSLAESFRSIRTALSFVNLNKGLQHLLVTSPSPMEGKTLVSVNLAITLAQDGKKVLLVDADLRKARLHKVFRMERNPGLSNLLVNNDVKKLTDTVRPMQQLRNFYFLPCGPPPPNPSELLGTNRMKELISEMDENFDVVIFDTTPVINVADALILCNYLGNAVIVLRSFSTQRELARRTAELVTQAQGRILGVVLNNADAPKGAYYSHDYYYQQRYYGEENEESPSKRT